MEVASEERVKKIVEPYKLWLEGLEQRTYVVDDELTDNDPFNAVMNYLQGGGHPLLENKNGLVTIVFTNFYTWFQKNNGLPHESNHLVLVRGNLRNGRFFDKRMKYYHIMSDTC